MKKELLAFITSIYFSILFFVCNGQSDSDKISANHKSNDTVTKEIPLDRKGNPDLFYLLAKQKARQLELDSLELGYDSLQLRIWFDYSLSKRKHLVVIKRVKDKWLCQLYIMETHYDASKDRETILTKNIKVVQPKSGWIIFTRTLFALKITTLTSGPEGGMDGVGYNVEVATKHQYRFYEYWSPETTQDKSWGSKNMVEIIKFLERECDFKRLQE
jgi:hypothetical protein